jgi:DNA polymerase
MSLVLDARQRAMLQEMGVRVWTPRDAPEPPAVLAGHAKPRRAAEHEPATLPGVPPAAAAPVAPAAPLAKTAPSPTVAASHSAAPESPPSPGRVTGLVGGIAQMDWTALTEAVRQCQACAMCLGRRAPVLAAPELPTPCDWLLVGDPPDEAQERAGQPFVEEAGQLLDNMLRAVAIKRWNHGPDAGAAPASRAYLSPVLKCRPALMRAPNATELATCAHFLRREIALTQPKVIVAMGRFAMQLLLSDTPPEQARLPLGKLRGRVWRFADVPVVVTYPPAYLLRNGQDKARAWADLCLARALACGALTNP